MSIVQIKPRLWWPGIHRQDSLARGLVGYWPLWEGAGDRVMDVVNNNTGLFVDFEGDEWGVDEHGSKLTFADEHISVPNRPVYDTGTQLTILARITPTGATARGIIGKYNTSGSNRQWRYRIFTNHKPQLFISSDGSANDSSLWTASGFNVGPGETAVVCATYNAGFVEHYKNGGFVNSDTLDQTSIHPGSAEIEIGSGFNSGSEQYLGGISYVILWNRALSASEVQQLYQRPYDLITPRPRRVFKSVAAPAGNAMPMAMDTYRMMRV